MMREFLTILTFMRRFVFSIALLTLATFAWGKHPAVLEFPKAPWFTGPLLAPAGHITPIGMFDFEPYFYVVCDNGNYTSHWKKVSQPQLWINSLQLYTVIGLTNWMDFSTTPTISYNASQGKSQVLFNDLEMQLDFQLLSDTPDNYVPALKLSLKETFPNGKYDHLDPDKFGTDIGGQGGYISGAVLTFSRLFHLGGEHWLNARLAAEYDITTRAHVHGYNNFGGGEGTDGYVYPPQVFLFDLAAEISLTRNWCFACDTVGRLARSTKFKGNPGIIDGALASSSRGSSAQYSLAPAIEYNWNENLGLISGAWFSVAGRNIFTFASWVTALNYYF